MMDTNTLRNEIVLFCQANADEAIVKKYAIYFKEGKEGYDAYGLSTPLILEKVKELNNNPAVTLELLLRTAPFLLKSGKHEEAIFILLLVEKHLKQLTSSNFDDIAEWYQYGIINWAHSDCLCNKIVPWFFLL